MINQFFSTARRGGRHAVIALALIGTLLSSVTGAVAPAALADPAATANAASDDKLDPDARLQIIIKSIKINDDNDWGEGDMRFNLWFWRVKPECSDDATSEECTTDLLESAPMKFGADDHETVPVNREIPDPTSGAKVYESSISPELGIPVFKDQRYGLVLVGVEEDTVIDDDMGTLRLSLTADNGWSLGETQAVPVHGVGDSRCHIIPPGCGFQSKAINEFDADFSVLYEIRRIPLPDLVPAFYEQTGDNGRKFYCARVTNSGQSASQSFRLTASADQTVLRSVDMPALDVGQNARHCVQRSELPTGPSALSFRVDEARQIAEMDEHNNTIQMQVAAAAPPPQSDLIVASIRVNGKDVTPQLQCKAGKNDLTVAVTNQGAAAAAASTLRLIVDEVPLSAIEKPVTALDASKTLEVAFDDVQLKKGAHTIVAMADSKRAITESREDNNQLSVTVKCKDDDE